MIPIKLLVIDVDGTLTDGGIYYDDCGNEWKKFNTKDAAGFFEAKRAGIKTMVLTGRECAATTRRMEELKVDYLYQNVKDKTSFLEDFLKKRGLVKEDVGYIGDDINDFGPLKLAGYVMCPSDACKSVRDIADYVSPVAGGHGAVRDVIEQYILPSKTLRGY